MGASQKRTKRANTPKKPTPAATIRALKAEIKRLREERDHFYKQVVALLPRRPKLDRKTVVQDQRHKKGVRAIFGKWPGDETDEQIEQAMKELS